MTAVITATPAKLRDGSWGIRTTCPVTPGQIVEVTSKAGKTWRSKVVDTVWTDGKVCLSKVTRADDEAIIGQHWSQRGKGPAVRLCAGGCGRTVKPQYTHCYQCYREEIDAM